MNQFLIKNKNLIEWLSFVSFVVGVFIYFSSYYFFSDSFLPLLGFIFWFSSCIFLSFEIVRPIFKEKIISFLMSCLLIIYVFGFFIGALNSFLFLNYLIIIVGFSLTFLFLIFFNSFLKNRILIEEKKVEENVTESSGFFSFFFIITSLALFWGGFYFLITSFSSDKVFNPWQVLSLDYLFICLFYFAFILFFIFFVKINKGVILFSIVLLSFLVHGYLMVASEGFNADRFRHLGSEYRLITQIPQIDPDIKTAKWNDTRNILGIEVPKPLINLNQFSYSFQWSLVAFLSSVLKVNLYYIDLYFGWILFSLFFPLIFYLSAKFFSSEKSFSLFISLASLIPSILIYYGGQTLPATFGVLFFLLILLFCLSLLNRWDNYFFFFVLFLVLLSFFAYTLTFILSLFLLLALLAIYFNKVIIFLPAFILIFLADLLSSFSWLSQASFFDRIRLASIRFFDLNIIFFNHDWIYNRNYDWLNLFWIILTLFVYVFLVIVSFLFYKKSKEIKYLFFLFLSFFSNFLLSVFLLDGSLILTRRLNVFIAVIFVFLLAWGFYYFFKSKLKIVAFFTVIVCFGLSFVSGPFTSFAVSSNEVLIARTLSEEIGNDWDDYCILAETTVLLPLESFTLRELSGGNFPIGLDHSQVEFNQLLNKVKFELDNNTVTSIFEVSKKDKCFIVLQENFIINNEESFYRVLGQARIIEGNYIWLINYEK